MNEDQVLNLLLWLHYNYKRSNDIDDFLSISRSYKLATDVTGEFCNCKNPSIASNLYNPNWHCTYCFKLIKNKN